MFAQFSGFIISETSSLSDVCLHLSSSVRSSGALLQSCTLEGCHLMSCKSAHVSEQSLLSFPDSLAPAQHLHRRTPAPPRPPRPLPPPRRSRRSFCLKIPSCHCTPAAQWAARSSSSSLLQAKVTHTHTHTSNLWPALVTFSVTLNFR